MQNTREVKVEEVVAMFCMIAGHCLGQGIAADRHQHSTQTINRHVKTVMRALVCLGKTYIKVRHKTGVHRQIQGDPLFSMVLDMVMTNYLTHNISKLLKTPDYHRLIILLQYQKYIGAINGMHIKAWVLADQQVSCRDRKSECTQNVFQHATLTSCLHTRMLGGKERQMMVAFLTMQLYRNKGSSGLPMFSPSLSCEKCVFCFFFHRLTCVHFFKVITTLLTRQTGGFLLPYQGKRYYLQQFRGRTLPMGLRQLFNYRHASLRNQNGN